jgi:hypothetical protein
VGVRRVLVEGVGEAGHRHLLALQRKSWKVEKLGEWKLFENWIIGLASAKTWRPDFCLEKFMYPPENKEPHLSGTYFILMWIVFPEMLATKTRCLWNHPVDLWQQKQDVYGITRLIASYKNKMSMGSPGWYLATKTRCLWDNLVDPGDDALLVHGLQLSLLSLRLLLQGLG